MHACAHWPESSLLVHTKNVCTCVHTCMYTFAHILCAVKTLASVRMCAHTCAQCTHAHASQSLHCSYTQRMCAYVCTLACTQCTHALTGQSLHCSYTQRMCTHMCILACTHVHTFFVCTGIEDSGQCAQSAHTCAHWPESLLLVHTKNGSR